MVTKHRVQLMGLGALGRLSKESYGKSYSASVEKMLSEGTLELFLDSRARLRKAGDPGRAKGVLSPKQPSSSLPKGLSAIAEGNEGQAKEGVLPRATLGAGPSPARTAHASPRSGRTSSDSSDPGASRQTGSSPQG